MDPRFLTAGYGDHLFFFIIFLKAIYFYYFYHTNLSAFFSFPLSSLHVIFFASFF